MAAMRRYSAERIHDWAHGGDDAERDPCEITREVLYRRLEDGYHKVEQGLAEGRDVSDWEAFWIELLREYERVCDDLAAERELAA